ncbi:MAG: MBL fold metallo-hydrolase [Alphaproteobacteria bacterium]|nr:MBL fold metallo-hydrolase [Alphaproteobacteria bacterium]
MTNTLEELAFPWPQHPGPDQLVELRPGLLWARLRLPFRLNHINIYLIADHGGYAVVDTGFGDAGTIAAWVSLFEGPLAGSPITQVIVTHAHPDHIGLAGWLVERFSCRLRISRVEYLWSLYIQSRTRQDWREAQRRFFRRHGADDAVSDQLMTQGMAYLAGVSPLPGAFHHLGNGDRLVIGPRKLQAVSGGGHSVDSVMLFCEAEKLLFSGDQVLSRISPNVSVWPLEPEQDALGDFLTSLCHLAATLPDDTLVLPAHGLPFHGLKTRLTQLHDHHIERCALIAEACRNTARSAAELVPVVFDRHDLDAHETGFATGELIAHLNYMLAQGRLTAHETGDMVKFTTT